MKCLSCSIDSESRQMLIRESASFESGLARGAERSVSRASMIMVTCSLRVPVFFRDPYGPAVSDQKVELSEKAWPAAGRLELWLRSAPGLSCEAQLARSALSGCDYRNASEKVRPEPECRQFLESC